MNGRVLITGASSGIGAALAVRLIQDGYDLVLTARRTERLRALTHHLLQQYPNRSIEWRSLDVRNECEVIPFFQDLELHGLLPTVLINNAGLAAGLAHVDHALSDDWNRMIDTNIKGAFFMCKHLIPYLKLQNAGHIVQMSSVVSREVYAGGSVYSATKHALDAFHRTLRLELLPWNIKLTSINPGLVETEFSLVRFNGDQDRAASVYEELDPLQPEDVADAVAYCLSLPAHVNIPELHITAACQATATKVRKHDGTLRG
jgi:3-hydroxy acid dehydrogenase / malonic semialdehyde reductase